MTTKVTNLNIDTTTINTVGTLSSLTVAGTVTLGTVDNVHITGGLNAQLLTTDGAGNLSWTTVTSGSSTSNATIRSQAMTMGIIFGG